MRKFYFLFVFLILSFFLYAQDIPQPTGWVNDFAKVLSPEYAGKLNSLIAELEEKTSAEIAVVTIESIAPFDEKEYTRLLFDKWSPGKKGKDNGVLVLVAIKERRWRVETGYGIEGILPDGLCGEIGRAYMVPYFKEGKYSEGIYQGVLKISEVIAKNANVSLKTLENFKEVPLENETPWEAIAPLIFLSSIIGLLILFNYLSYKQRKNGYDYGGHNYSGGSWGGGFASGGFGGGGGFGGFGGGGGGAGGGF